jgi:hypothetical protein
MMIQLIEAGKLAIEARFGDNADYTGLSAIVVEAVVEELALNHIDDVGEFLAACLLTSVTMRFQPHLVGVVTGPLL